MIIFYIKTEEIYLKYKFVESKDEFAILLCRQRKIKKRGYFCLTF